MLDFSDITILVVKMGSLWAQVTAQAEEVVRVRLFYKEKDALHNSRQGKELSSLLQRLKEDIQLYGEGVRVDFSRYPLRLTSYTDFARRVWEQVRRVPYGEVRSYKWVGTRVSCRGYRAIGKILSCNPFPILVPCHRIIREDGSLGGYSQGLKVKEELLRMEGVTLGRENIEQGRRF